MKSVQLSRSVLPILHIFFLQTTKYKFVMLCSASKNKFDVSCLRKELADYRFYYIFSRLVYNQLFKSYAMAP